jgi:HEAT repeat protein
MSSDLKLVSARLKSLATSSNPSAQDIREVEALIEHPKEGVQVLAGRTLAAWRSRSSKPVLRAWFEDTLQRRHGHAVQAQAAKALALFLDAADSQWALDLYFANTRKNSVLGTTLAIRTLLPLIEALPSKLVAQRATAEATSSRANIRRAAAFALYAAGDRAGLQTLLQDSSRDVSILARNLLKRMDRAV